MGELFPDTNFSHYRIVRKLGAGGMGEVYLAEDTKLDRRVALKILPEDLAIEDDLMRRFVQEAKTASALNHPNIITIHEIGEIGDKHFIASEYIDGMTLRSRLRTGPMSLAAVLDAGIQIASALQAAHDAKIIHRDIKPENVMLRPDALLKVLDFGIAKVSESPAAFEHNSEATTIQGITSPGVVVGTAAYMSPEQARGKGVDSRTDIFSLGVVLYEMLAARHPFKGESMMDVIGAILHKEPRPLRQLMPEVPSEIERIINKLLKKDRDERYQTASDLLVDLKDVRRELDFQDKLRISAPPLDDTEDLKSTTVMAAQTAASSEYSFGRVRKRRIGYLGALAALLIAMTFGAWYLISGRRSSPSSAEAPINSIAVLPFQNKSTDAETEYLSEGLAESLIFRLSQLSNLKVSPPSSVSRYKGNEIDPIKAAGELGVSSVMTGRFAQHGDDLTLTVALVDVRNNKLLWGKQYDRKLGDIMATQREITAEITQNLRLKLSGADQSRVTKQFTKDPEAYRLYLKGHYYSLKYTKEGFNKGIEYFDQAIAKDPNYALAYSGLAFCYMNQTDWVFAPKDSIPKARHAVENALRIDEDLAEAHTMKAMLLLGSDAFSMLNSQPTEEEEDSMPTTRVSTALILTQRIIDMFDQAGASSKERRTALDLARRIVMDEILRG